MPCKNCDLKKRIVNKHFGLCDECNNIRLHGSKYGKQYKHTKKPRKSLKSYENNLKQTNKKQSRGTKNRKSLFTTNIKLKKKEKTMLELDEEFYKKCFDNSDHKCEECNCDLPTNFRNEDGFIEARWRFSHILPKSIAPELRHNIDNINHLCLSDHQEWENGDKKSMKIYTKNKARWGKYF